MSTVTAFTEMMAQFIDELVHTFPEEKALKKGKATLDIMKSANPRAVVDYFMKATAPYQARIMSKDESLFTEDVDFMGGVKMNGLWTPRPFGWDEGSYLAVPPDSAHFGHYRECHPQGDPYGHRGHRGSDDQGWYGWGCSGRAGGS